MAKRSAGGRKKDDAAWVEAALKKLITDAGFSTLAELEARVSVDAGGLPDIDMELPEFEADLPSFHGSADRPPTGLACPKAPLPVASGTRIISIRIQDRVLLAFKAQAEKTGTPYQTLMKRALADSAERFI